MVNGATVANLKPDFIDLHCGTPLCCCCQLLGVDFGSVDAMFCGLCHVFCQAKVSLLLIQFPSFLRILSSCQRFYGVGWHHNQCLAARIIVFWIGILRVFLSVCSFVLLYPFRLCSRVYWTLFTARLLSELFARYWFGLRFAWRQRLPKSEGRIQETNFFFIDAIWLLNPKSRSFFMFPRLRFDPRVDLLFVPSQARFKQLPLWPAVQLIDKLTKLLTVWCCGFAKLFLWRRSISWQSSTVYQRGGSAMFSLLVPHCFSCFVQHFAKLLGELARCPQCVFTFQLLKDLGFWVKT